MKRIKKIRPKGKSSQKSEQALDQKPEQKTPQKSKKKKAVKPIELSKEEARALKRKQRKTKKRIRIAKGLLIFILVLGLFAGGILGFYQAIKQGVFNISEIEVVGNEIIEEKDVIAATGIKLGDSIFFTDLNQANYNIRELLGLAELETSKIFPNKILIRMVELAPICVVNFNDELFYLDGEGKLIENSQYLRKTNIPIVFGVEKIIIGEIGREVEIEPGWRFDIVMYILKELELQGNLDKISEIRLTADNNYEIVTKSGTVIKVWDYENFLENEAYINANLDQNTSNMNIDVTTGDKPVIKPR